MQVKPQLQSAPPSLTLLGPPLLDGSFRGRNQQLLKAGPQLRSFFWVMLRVPSIKPEMQKVLHAGCLGEAERFTPQGGARSQVPARQQLGFHCHLAATQRSL